MGANWFIVSVEAAIVHEGCYLVIVRSATEAHAAGVLSLPGGKVEYAGDLPNILEETLRREIQEEVGISVSQELVYLESAAFMTDDGRPMIGVGFLCRYAAGTPTITNPDEVAALGWMAADAILAELTTPGWMRTTIEQAETKRLALGW
jgi:8-oxo-dGTP pyrophosphatase MutT (NUDIX family)